MNKKIITLCVLSVTQLMGCAQMSRLDAKLSPSIQNSQTEVDKKLADTLATKESPYVTETVIPFISKRVIPQSAVETLPPLFKKQVTVNETFTNLNAIADYVYWKFNVPVFIDKKVSTSESKSSTSTGGVGGQFNASVTAPKSNVANTTEIGAISINYKNGTLKGLLDTIADKQGISWKFENNTIKLFLTETKYFTFAVSPLKKKVSNSLSQNGSITSSTGTVGSGSKQSLTVDYSVDQLKSLMDAIQKMQTKDGSAYYNDGTSTLSVTDTPNALAEITKYVDLQQKILSKNALVTLKTYELSATDADNLGLDVSLGYNSPDRIYSYKNTGNDSDTTAGGLITGAITATTNRFKGSALALNALAKAGKAKILRTAYVRLFNNEPTNFVVGNEKNYLKSVENTTTSGSTSTQSKMEPGTVETGFSVAMLANIGMDNNMVFNFNLLNGDLVGNKFDTYTSGGSSIQLATISKFQINQTFPVKSGESYVLMGFSADNQGVDKHGTLSPDNVLMGGGSSLSQEKKVLVIEITPVVLN